MKLSQLALSSALVLGTACTNLEQTAGPDPEPSADTTPDGPQDGDTGTMKVRTSDGKLHDVTYVVQQGRAMWQGDIDLGPAPRSGVRSNVIRDLGKRWPGGILDFTFDSTVSASTKATIRTAHTEIERLTPIRFHEGATGTRPSLLYGTSTQTNVSFTTGIGADGTDPGDTTDVNIFPSHPRSLVIHELGHALGLHHEAMRSDRDQFIQFEDACTTNAGQYDVLDDDDFQRMTFYDLSSIMHYASRDFCIGPGPLAGNCFCFPIVERGGNHFTGLGEIPKPSKLSPGDIRSLTRMYEPKLGVNENGDRYGYATAVGDFNGDTFKDLAVGVPGENGNQGMVFLYMGTETGLVAWKRVTAGSSAQGGAQFGLALAAGDVTGDGIADLIVGAPGQNGQPYGSIAAGAVYIFKGGDAGPVDGAGLFLSQSIGGGGTDVFADAYGSALAVGNFDGTGALELAVGVPGKQLSGVRVGSVYVYKVNSSGIASFWRSSYEPGTTQASDKFGTALAAGDLNDDGIADLVVGAPALNRAGQVFLFYDVMNTMTHVFPLAQPAGSRIDPPAANDQFGASLAIGRFDLAKVPGTTRFMNELAVGAPNKTSGQGRVYILKPQWDGWGTYVGLAVATSISQTGTGQSNVAGDTFGAALVAHDFNRDGFDDLAVGVPGKDTDGKVDAGLVEMFRGSSTSILVGNSSYVQSPFSTTSAGDRFGASLVAGDFNDDGVKELVAGAPVHKNSLLENNGITAGAIHLFLGIDGTMPLTLGTFIDETVASPE